MITVRVKFFAHFREVFGAKDKDITLPDGATVGDILDSVCDTAERRSLVFDGGLRPGVVVMKNGASILSLQGLATPLGPKDTVAVFPLLCGG